MKNNWSNIPEQIKRLSVIAFILVLIFFISRYLLIPEDFGEYGHYRTSAVENIVKQNIHFAGHQICNDCHDDVVDQKKNGFHKNLSCEVCHGPAAAHIENDEIRLEAPRDREYCVLCHEYLPSRPTGFPQINSNTHNPMKPCITCHDPHEPEPPQAPKECKACHAEIANSKSISKHINVPCIRCHITPQEHKINPREITPSKPQTRKFCGECHAESSEESDNIPKIDLDSHEPRYVCWQCHYPHLPEVK